MALFEHVLVPVASDGDASETAAALDPCLDDIHRLTAIHVVETRPGAVDKAPVGKRRADAEAFLSVLASRLDGRVVVDTRIAFGATVAETVVETALDVGATAIAFRSRGSGRLARLLSGNTTTRLVTDPEIPVISLAGGRRGVADPPPRAEGG